MRLARTWPMLLPLLLVACGLALTDKDRRSIAREGVLIGVCQSEASECGKRVDASTSNPAPQCWDVFDACLLDAGIRVSKDGAP